MTCLASAVTGMCRCPNGQCRAFLMFIADTSGNVEAALPPRRLEFDPTGVPEAVLSAFAEAIMCHSQQCYVASAIMLRKALDLICKDSWALGGNLKERIRALRSKVVIPEELLDGMDGLRLLGNDAAHVEADVFNTIGKEEIEVAVAFTKEILKGVYQYSALLDRLKGLKKGP